MPAGAETHAKALRSRVIGQDEACAISAQMLAQFKAGLNDPEKPVGTLLFVGPTGVGKTELAKCIADVELPARICVARNISPTNKIGRAHV